MRNAKKKVGKPVSEEAKRVAALFGRRLTTPWTAKEVETFLTLKDDIVPDDLTMLERYYAAERKKGDRGVHRRDLQTLLNNFWPELDRARAFCDRHPVIVKEPRKIIPLPPVKTQEPELSAEDREAGAKFMEKFGLFKKVRQTMGK